MKISIKNNRFFYFPRFFFSALFFSFLQQTLLAEGFGYFHAIHNNFKNNDKQLTSFKAIVLLHLIKLKIVTFFEELDAIKVLRTTILKN